MWKTYLLIGILLLSNAHALGFSQNITNATKTQFLTLDDSTDRGETIYTIKNPGIQNVTFWTKTITNSTTQKIIPEDLTVKVITAEGGYSSTELQSWITTQQTKYNYIIGNTSTPRIVVNLTNFNTTHVRYIDSLIDDNYVVFKRKTELNGFNVATNTINEWNYHAIPEKNITVGEWVNFDPAKYSVPSQGNLTVKVKIEPTISRMSDNKWGYRIDNILCFAGYCYDEYSWANTSFGYRVNITFNTTYDKSNTENLTNYTALIVLNTSNVNYSNIQSAGQDIRFVDEDDNTLLDYEIEKWNSSGNSYIWVRVPQLNGNTTTDKIILYYGCPTCSDAQNSFSLWSGAGYIGVWHMNNVPNATAPQLIDSLKKTNGTMIGGMTANNVTSTFTGQGMVFNTSQAFNLTDYSYIYNRLNNSLNLTFEGVSFYNNSAFASAILLNIDSSQLRHQSLSGNIGSRFALRNSTATTNLDNTSANYSRSWLYMTMTYFGTASTGTKTTYVNRTLAATTSSQTKNFVYILTSSSPTACINAGGPPACNAGNFGGILDEIRVSNTTKSSQWRNATYQNILNSTSFLTFGSIETAPTGGVCSGTSDCTITCPTTISSNVDVGGYNLLFTGSGRADINARIYNTRFVEVRSSSGCVAIVNSALGGKLE